MYYVYILQSLVINRFYIGVTSDREERLVGHNSGGTKSTKPYKPWRVVYNEKFIDKSEAYKREFYLKSAKGYLEKRRIIDTLIK